MTRQKQTLAQQGTKLPPDRSSEGKPREPFLHLTVPCSSSSSHLRDQTRVVTRCDYSYAATRGKALHRTIVWLQQCPAMFRGTCSRQLRRTHALTRHLNSQYEDPTCGRETVWERTHVQKGDINLSPVKDLSTPSFLTIIPNRR